MTHLISILHDYVNIGFLFNVLKPKYAYFNEKYNINFDSEFIPINHNDYKNIIEQTAGSSLIFDTQIKDIKYSFEYFKINNASEYDEKNFTHAIVIKRFNDKINEPNKPNEVNDEKYSSSKHCALLLYDDNELLKLAFLNMYADCYKTEEKNKSGSILLKLIILFAKEKGFKKIILSDQSQYNCKDTTYKVAYEIKYIHTLTHGKTWYQKYGFKFIDKVDEDAVNHNKSILDNLKTDDYPLDLLIKIIMYEVVDQRIYSYMDKYDYLFNINQIIKFYDTYKDKPFYSFMKVISREYCFLVSHIYMKIFESLRLKKYINSEMELIIKQN